MPPTTLNSPEQTRPDAPWPPRLSDEQRAQQFHALAETWRRETAPLSSLEEKFLHPAYQRIIGMGGDAVPLILDELRRKPGHWFWALKAITGANPMRPEHAGNVKRMTADWLAWGDEHGYTNGNR